MCIYVYVCIYVILITLLPVSLISRYTVTTGGDTYLFFIHIAQFYD